jgi:sugar phosphate permease
MRLSGPDSAIPNLIAVDAASHQRAAGQAGVSARRPVQGGWQSDERPAEEPVRPRALAVAGQVSMVIGLTALILTAPFGSPILTAVLLILIGPGGSVAVPVMTGLDSVPPECAGTASAVFNTFRQVGGAVAVAVFGALLANSVTFVGGMQISVAITATLLLATALISLRIPDEASPR